MSYRFVKLLGMDFNKLNH